MKKTIKHATLGCTLLIILISFLQVHAAPEAPDSPDAPLFQQGFPVSLEGSSRVTWSSIALGDLNNDGKDDIVVGDSSGRIHAYTGSGQKLWSVDTGDMGIESKAAIGDINQDGWNEVVVSAGSTLTPNSHGGLYVFNHNGQQICALPTVDQDGNGWREGMYSSPALADIDRNDNGKLEIIVGGWDMRVYVLNHDCSVVWTKFTRDSVWSSPAIGDIDRDGYLDIVIGTDSHDEPALVPPIYKGGRIEVWDRVGNNLPGFPKHLDEVIYSSPALGDLNNDGWLDIVVGTGYYWDNPNCGHPDGCTPGLTHYVHAWNHLGQTLPGWPIITSDYVQAAPSLADINNDGKLEVIVNDNSARVYAWKGNGTLVSGWPTMPVIPSGCSSTSSSPSDASPIVADINGDGGLEVLLPSGWEIVVWNKNGQQLTRTRACPDNGWNLATQYSLNSSPAVGDIDKDGDLEVVIGGAAVNTGTPGAIYAWDFAGAATEDALAWPMFRGNASNTGTPMTPPNLVVSSSSLVTLTQVDVRHDAVLFFSIANSGDGDLHYSISKNSSIITVSPSSGIVSAHDEVEIAVIVDLTTLSSVGSYQYQLTITATDGQNPLPGSPYTLPLTVVVAEEIHQVFLPTIIK